jgi:hypothetical protein
VLIDDAIQTLKTKDTKGALVHLNILSQQLTALGSSYAVESTNDATTALTSGDANKALVHLNLVKQQLVSNSSSSNTITTTTSYKLWLKLIIIYKGFG